MWASVGCIDVVEQALRSWRWTWSARVEVAHGCCAGLQAFILLVNTPITIVVNYGRFLILSLVLALSAAEEAKRADQDQNLEIISMFASD
jgi:hypothetical protein